MRRVAAVRWAGRALARTTLHAATRSAAAARDALTAAEREADAAFAAWRGQTGSDRFAPEFERHFAAQLVARADDHAAAGEANDVAVAELCAARQALHRAEAAVEQGATLVARLGRAERMRREERRMADHADVVTRNWRGA